MRLLLAPGSGSVLPEGDDDVEAEGLELALGVAGLAAAVGVPGVPVGSEVPLAGGGVVQQVQTVLRLEVEHECGDDDDHAPRQRFSVVLRDNRAAVKCSNRTARHRPLMTGINP
jgi:hypothetical protein